jgi:nucleosome binding factor SPN SPT16 subunit
MHYHHASILMEWLLSMKIRNTLWGLQHQKTLVFKHDRKYRNLLETKIESRYNDVGLNVKSNTQGRLDFCKRWSGVYRSY